MSAETQPVHKRRRCLREAWYALQDDDDAASTITVCTRRSLEDVRSIATTGDGSTIRLSPRTSPARDGLDPTLEPPNLDPTSDDAVDGQPRPPSPIVNGTGQDRDVLSSSDDDTASMQTDDSAPATTTATGIRPPPLSATDMADFVEHLAWRFRTALREAHTELSAPIALRELASQRAGLLRHMHRHRVHCLLIPMHFQRQHRWFVVVLVVQPLNIVYVADAVRGVHSLACRVFATFEGNESSTEPDAWRHVVLPGGNWMQGPAASGLAAMHMLEALIVGHVWRERTHALEGGMRRWDAGWKQTLDEKLERARRSLRRHRQN